MDCSPSGKSVHGISQARILEWVAISHSRVGSGLLPHPSIKPVSPALAGEFFTTEPPEKPSFPDRDVQLALLFLALYVTLATSITSKYPPRHPSEVMQGETVASECGFLWAL